MSAVPIRLFHRKRVRQMPHLAHCAVLQQNFDDVEADLHLRLLEPPEIIERALGKQPAFARVHGGGWADPLFGGTGFDLDEYQAIGVAEHEVDFAAIRPEVRGEKFEAELSEV